MDPLTTPQRSFFDSIVSIVCLLVSSLALSHAAEPLLPQDVNQLIVAVGDDWSSTRAQLMCFERRSSKDAWQPVLANAPIPVLLGSKGMAWGLGALPVPPQSPQKSYKREGDGKAPAGCFAIGKIFGNPPKLPEGADFPYRQVTKWDAWVDDVKNPYYNQHVVVDPKNPPAWFDSQRMRQGDFAYEFLVELRHNADPPRPGFGSAIFFHIRRGPNRKTSGCTTMERGNLINIVQWLREEKRPHYVLLPKQEYRALLAAWDLPPFPESATD